MTQWREYAVLAVLILLMWGAMKLTGGQGQIDCRQLAAGWHPDIPGHVRDACKHPNKLT